LLIPRVAHDDPSPELDDIRISDVNRAPKWIAVDYDGALDFFLITFTIIRSFA